MKTLALINPGNISNDEAKMYPIREAARAIVLDDKNNVALLHVTKENYYKLPGGGIETSEDKLQALKRECLEEIGCSVEIISEVGIVVEYRNPYKLKQISYCYLAKIKGEKGLAQFTNEEIEDGFTQMWVPFDKALEIMSEIKTTNEEGKTYIIPRDTILLKEAYNLIQDNKITPC